MHDIHNPSTLELDDSFVARLYQQHALFLMTYVRRHVPSREEAEDVLLDIFLAALEHPELERFREQRQLAWLQRVAYHKCVDYHRRVSRRHQLPLETVAGELAATETLEPDQQAIRNEEDAVLYRKLAELPAAYQNVLQLRFAYGLRCQEIARRLNKSEGATRMLLSRALTLLLFDRQGVLLARLNQYNVFAIQAYNNTLYIGYQSGLSDGGPAVLAALNIASGQLLWQKTYGSVETITVSNGIYYGLSWTGDGKQGIIYALNASSGTQLWTMPTDVGILQWGGITIVS